MSGKITFRKGLHDSRSAYWADQITLSATNVKELERTLGRAIESHERTNLTNIAIKELETALGRALATDEAHHIVAGLETVSGYRSRWTISRQDIVKSLAAISKLPPIDALAAMKLMDSSSRALLKTALRYDCGFREQGVEPPAPLIPKAAAIALAEFTAMSVLGGQPVNGYQRAIARFAIDTWLAFGQTDMRAQYSGGGAQRYDKKRISLTPLMAWTAIFFVSSGETANYSQIKKILSSMSSAGKVNTACS